MYLSYNTSTTDNEDTLYISILKNLANMYNNNKLVIKHIIIANLKYGHILSNRSAGFTFAILNIINRTKNYLALKLSLKFCKKKHLHVTQATIASWTVKLNNLTPLTLSS